MLGLVTWLSLERVASITHTRDDLTLAGLLTRAHHSAAPKAIVALLVSAECPACRASARDYAALEDSVLTTGAEFLTVITSPPQAAAQYARLARSRAPLVTDHDAKLAMSAGAVAWPTLLLVSNRFEPVILSPWDSSPAGISAIMSTLRQILADAPPGRASKPEST